MDHALRTISYIADIGNIVVLMARRRMPRAASQDCIETTPGAPEGKKQYKMICHVFESEDVSERRAGPQHCRRLGNTAGGAAWLALEASGSGATGGPTASCRGRGGRGRPQKCCGHGPLPGDVAHTLLHPLPPQAGAGQEGAACGSGRGTP